MVYSYRTGVIAPFVQKFKKQLILLVAAIFLASMAAFTLSASAAPSVINDDNFAAEGWQEYTTSGGSVSFEAVAGAPSGDGALHLTTQDDNNSRARLFKELPTPVALDEVSDAGYWTKALAGKSGASDFLGASVSFYMMIDTDGDTNTSGDSTSLVHEPYWQDTELGDPYPVERDVWQEWDVLAGSYWSSQNAGGFTAGSGGAPFYDFDEAKSTAPDAVVTAIGVYIGSYNPAYDTYADLVSFNGDEYDFEVAPPFEETGVITNPANDGDAVKGQVVLSATYDDGDTNDDDAVQWAVRADTCAAGTNTVFGNVDGFNDPYTWDGAEFEAAFNTTTVSDGDYCFVFNPTDDNVDVRETRTFVVDNTRPTAEFVNPNGEVYGDSVNVEFKMTDATSGLNNMVVNIYSGSTLLDTCGLVTNLDGAAEHTLECVIDTSGYADGTYNLKGGGFDKAGNNKTISTTFVVEHSDTTDPVVVLTNPEEGDVLSGVNTFEGTVTDDNNVRHRFLVRDVEDDNMVVYNSGNIFDSSAVVNASHAYDTASVPDGEYRIVLIGFDNENNARDRAVVTFENYVDSKDECKNGGWERGTFDGEEFRNQGDCVKHFTGNGHHAWWKFWKWNWWNNGWGWFGHNFNWGWSWWR